MDLSETHVDDEGISCLTSERYPKLEYLSLDSLDISDDGINSIFAGLPKIRYISIENTIVRDTLDTVIALNDKYEWVDVNSSDSDSDSDE
ncbi:hypothetical protein AX774_g7055 [Zancudomyces culisetae]|uniref:Uncharacterized protein n=1 Tax=Zancudomyces culisetae TaxID=1213189 RepID=A0A1R1PEY4_ZANCU|nr:hypothetical protein AX774_g7055 [Zancudomyces culisetae]|eukprot:OMH79527.1 hypothetical protein AX774_g7055 [Zancudomyces culisetae]